MPNPAPRVAPYPSNQHTPSRRVARRSKDRPCDHVSPEVSFTAMSPPKPAGCWHPPSPSGPGPSPASFSGADLGRAAACQEAGKTHRPCNVFTGRFRFNRLELPQEFFFVSAKAQPPNQPARCGEGKGFDGSPAPGPNPQALLPLCVPRGFVHAWRKTWFGGERSATFLGSTLNSLCV